MDTHNNYKRTVSGSVGAGMGAIFNGSGRTYYMLEHRDSTQFHRLGETQKIIIDQIELGRDASCQVRFDESCETVSRKHAAIVREGDNWKLIHLSQSNPTLVNGRPINGTYFLQSGDEIQLSIGGPRMGFIVPQGRQAMTSSIRLTERMNLFRKQALRPYRRAVWTLGVLLLLTILGFGAWNYWLGLKNEDLKSDIALSDARNRANELKIDSLAKELIVAREDLANNPGDVELQRRVYELEDEVTTLRNRPVTIVHAPAVQEAEADNEDVARPANPTSKTASTASSPTPANASSAPITLNSSDNIADYYDDIYTLKVRKITLEYGGSSVDAGIATTNIVVGTGFVVDGRFITARSNIHPWIYRDIYNDPWRHELAKYVAMGVKVIIDYEAYSTRGSGHPLRFSNIQFDEASLSAFDEMKVVEIEREYRRHMKTWWGVDIEYSKKVREQYKAPVMTARSYNAASLALGAPGGLPIDNVTARSLKGGEEVVIAGFSSRTDIQNLSGYFKYFTDRTSRVSGTFITLQTSDDNWGFTGAPAFFKGGDGRYRVIGVNAGYFGGEERIVPIHYVR